MKRFGIKMPNKARVQTHRLRVCPVCQMPKYRHEFRRSNRNAKTNVICWQCRHDNPQAVREFYAVGKGIFFKPETEAEFQTKVSSVRNFLSLQNERRKIKGKEVIEMQKIEKQAVALAKLPGKVAAIIGKTYSIRGDDFTLSDDEAIQRIRDALDEIDERLIERNKNKRLSR